MNFETTTAARDWAAANAAALSAEFDYDVLLVQWEPTGGVVLAKGYRRPVAVAAVVPSGASFRAISMVG